MNRPKEIALSRFSCIIIELIPAVFPSTSTGTVPAWNTASGAMLMPSSASGN